MSERPTLGEQELEALRFITERGAATVREVVSGFGEPRGLARTTILTVMERLRTKGFLTRERSAGDGSWVYSAAQKQSDLMQSLVENFVRKTLGGSVSPFIAYLAQAKNLSEAEKAGLRALVAALGEE